MSDPSYDDRLAALESARERRQYDPKQPDNFAGDKVGAGRYIICFLLAGLPGLWAAYWARYYGWRCVWISVAIFAAIAIVLLFMTYTPTEACYIDAYGREVCTYD